MANLFHIMPKVTARRILSSFKYIMKTKLSTPRIALIFNVFLCSESQMLGFTTIIVRNYFLFVDVVKVHHEEM